MMYHQSAVRTSGPDEGPTGQKELLVANMAENSEKMIAGWMQIKIEENWNHLSRKFISMLQIPPKMQK